MKIIPAIDIIEGKCVRLTRGDYNTRKTYRDDPVDVAKEFEDNGIRYLHLVDLDGARSHHIVNYRVLREITTRTSLKVDFGGGLKSDEDLRVAFENGAEQITGGSIAVRQPHIFLEWLTKYGPERIILGADSNHRRISTQGWTEQSDWDVVDFVNHYAAKGVQQVICTDIQRDGMLQGAAEDLYREIIAKSGVKLIASGGVSSMDDLAKLKSVGCDGAIIGKAIYEGSIKLEELKDFLS